MDEFKIKRGAPSTILHELVSESDTLLDSHIRDGMAVTIEKGKPLKEGENVYNISFFEPEKDGDNLTELFEITMDENALVGDVKKVLAVKLREELHKRISTSPGVPIATSLSPSPLHSAEDTAIPAIKSDYIRLRELTYSTIPRKIGKALPNNHTLKKALLTTKRIAIQLLAEPETVTENDHVIFVQQFKPSSYELTRKEDYVVHEGMSVEEFKAGLSKKYNIPVEHLGIARVDTYSTYDDFPDPLEIPKLGWDRYSPIRNLNELFLRSGSLFLVKNTEEPLKELSKEEIDAIEKENKKRTAIANSGYSNSYFWTKKERPLVINSN